MSHSATDGLQTTDFGDTDLVYSVAVQSDCKILVAGVADNGSNYDFALARYNTDGSLDATFGGVGKLTTDLGGSDYGYSVAIQSDGKIVVAGQSNNDFAVARYNTDGSLDTTFGDDGTKTIDLGGTEAGGYLAIQSDGKMVVAGTVDYSSVAVLRLHGETTQGGWTVDVLNVAPTVAINGIPSTPVEGTEINLTAAVADPGTLDTVFTYALDRHQGWRSLCQRYGF